MKRDIEVDADWGTTTYHLLAAVGFSLLTLSGSALLINNSHWIYFRRPGIPGPGTYLSLAVGLLLLLLSPKVGKIGQVSGLIIVLSAILRLSLHWLGSPPWIIQQSSFFLAWYFVRVWMPFTFLG